MSGFVDLVEAFPTARSKSGSDETKTPTYEKIMIPLRLPPEIYNRMMDEVQKKKKDERGYSVNQYLTDILTKDLEGKENEQI